MISSNRILKVLLFVMLCSGCMPAVVGIYYPEADGGKIIYADNPLSSHIPTAICFSHYDIKTCVEFREFKKNRWAKIRLGAVSNQEKTLCKEL